MKKSAILTAILSLAILAGCSSKPVDKMERINQLLAKKFEMTETQRGNVNKFIELSKKLKDKNQPAEAEKALAEAVKILEWAQEHDRFNKSE